MNHLSQGEEIAEQNGGWWKQAVEAACRTLIPLSVPLSKQNAGLQAGEMKSMATRCGW
jgi:hypothetical protein